jgi:DNA-binding NarL/FixJ family response regulator
MSLKVLIADDTTLFREGIKSLFGNHGQLAIVGEAANAVDAAEQAVSTEADVVLLDHDMPGLDCLEAIRLIKRSRSATEVIVLAETAQHERALRVVEAGASGYILKDIEPDDLVRAIVDVSNGCTLMNPRLARDLVAQLRVLARERREPQDGDQYDRLTGREKQILMELANGATDREIAHKMFVTTTTVKSHIRSIFRKIGVKNRTQAAVLVFKSGLAH